LGDIGSSSIYDDPKAKNEKIKLEPETIRDIKFGAESLRTTLREKYLGR
jgi:hypothetical protein